MADRTGRPAARRRGRSAAEPPDSGSAAHDAEPDPESVARAIVLRRLAAAAQSRGQLADALARRDVPADVATRVLDRFTEVGLIDDQEYARMFVRSRHAERGLSRRALGVELRRKGIDDETAAVALEDVDDADEEQAARELVRRRLRTTAGLETPVRVRRIYGALGRKGYSAGLVARIVREELATEGADDESLGELEA
ncbi:regulatory protein RecX [Cellulomonas xiejunii]|uniref:Regulatory protein RecX n=1 Tax=Cellulomonas xiejunii TaxID=2968083 RepID=A0ABY5KSU6_9CELL|nr:regulatory protein RecX [Cellulomonas xiejunii]MCC2322009.1 recombination regulator RecX [Cellulomonas xiejunii]UUI73304.1 recombination regulator RecX [Cellulomonas xiejunii]